MRPEEISSALALVPRSACRVPSFLPEDRSLAENRGNAHAVAAPVGQKPVAEHLKAGMLTCAPGLIRRVVRTTAEENSQAPVVCRFRFSHSIRASRRRGEYFQRLRIAGNGFSQWTQQSAPTMPQIVENQMVSRDGSSAEARGQKRRRPWR